MIAMTTDERSGPLASRPVPRVLRWCARRGRRRMLAAGLTLGLAAPAATAELPAVVANDNTRAAGARQDAVVSVRLRAARGAWRPEGEGTPALTVDALGEEGQPLTVPAPLLRVVEGTTLAVSVSNELDAMLTLHGLCARADGPCAPLDVPPHERREVRFLAGRPGTYHYWGSAIGAPIPFRELAGALVVDAAGDPAPTDRVFVITEWSNLTAAQLRTLLMADDVNEAFLAAKPRVAFMINGLSWPATERLQYPRGETVRWRVLNLSSQAHPLHLHGFYFRVVRTGNGLVDGAVRPSTGREVVTEVLRGGETMEIAWTPEREGNWLFHCHVMAHVSPARQLHGKASAPIGADPPAAGHGHAHGDGEGAAPDAALGMAGMVLGITVTPSPFAAPVLRSTAPPRHIRMVVGGDTARGLLGGVAIVEDDRGTATPQLTAPGPVLALQRGAPVEITVENRLHEPTSMHWHGLELESVYDGVHGWSGTAGHTAPMIAPGESFVVRLTPPRSGTFIYHTHVHDHRQLSSGVYGALVVAESTVAGDPASDHVVVVGRRDATEATSILEDGDSIVLNGEHAPRFSWRAGRTHRLRLVNITPDDVLSVSLTRGADPVTWRVVAKDGATLEPTATAATPARVVLAVGETTDVEIEAPAGPGQLWLEVRTTSGKWQAQGRVVLR